MSALGTPRPVAGIVGHDLAVARPFGELPVTGTPRAFVEHLARVGLRPIVMPGEYGVDLLDVVDVLVLTGGGDLDPALSGATADGVRGVDRARDDAEIALVRAAVDHQVPLLGCCRGLQVMAVALGGTLRSVEGHVQPGQGHDVHTTPSSLIAELVGPVVQTSALHQQAIADPGPSWRPTAWADGTIESIEPFDDRWPALGVQWHPELSGLAGFSNDTGRALFTWLAERARPRDGRLANF